MKPWIHTKTINWFVACGGKSFRNKFYGLVTMKYL